MADTRQKLHFDWSAPRAAAERRRLAWQGEWVWWWDRHLHHLGLDQFQVDKLGECFAEYVEHVATPTRYSRRDRFKVALYWLASTFKRG